MDRFPTQMLLGHKTKGNFKVANGRECVQFEAYLERAYVQAIYVQKKVVMILAHPQLVLYTVRN